MIDTTATSPRAAAPTTEPSHLHIPRPSRGPRADDRNRAPWAGHAPAPADPPRAVLEQA